MILPSDGDPPPRRNDDDDKEPSSEGAEEWWEEDAEEDKENPPPPGTVLKSIAGSGWREDLVRELVDSLDDLREIEDPDDEFEPPEPPDLYTFFGELAALRNEMRRTGRRAADAVVKAGDAMMVVQNLLQNTASPGKKSKSRAEPWPLETCLALVALHDLLEKSEAGAAGKASFEPLLKAAGMARVSTIGKVFDPATMMISKVESGGKKSTQTVLRETEAGFLRAGELLRPAKVVISG